MTRFSVRIILLAVGLGFAAAAQTQNYPNRPIRFIVPFAPGGTSDLVGRVLGAKISEGLGQTVVVDNRGGAGSTIGTQLAAKASPDGHTILVSHVGLAINETLAHVAFWDRQRLCLMRRWAAGEVCTGDYAGDVLCHLCRHVHR